MTIPWIRCADRMPPDDETVIVKGSYLRIRHGATINNLKRALDYSETSWIPYDEETWKELNKS